ITNVKVSKPFFNPSFGQKEEITFDVVHPGKLSALILDRDGYVTKKLLIGKTVAAGALSFVWDGKKNQGEVVGDEAYSLKLDLISDEENETYFPANTQSEEIHVKPKYYDRQNGILSYILPRPCRVHIQAGTAIIDPKTKEAQGPVLKTIVNREPRIA